MIITSLNQIGVLFNWQHLLQLRERAHIFSFFLQRVKEHPRPRVGAEVRPSGEHARLPALAHQANRVHVSSTQRPCTTKPQPNTRLFLFTERVQAWGYFYTCL